MYKILILGNSAILKNNETSNNENELQEKSEQSINDQLPLYYQYFKEELIRDASKSIFIKNYYQPSISVNNNQKKIKIEAWHISDENIISEKNTDNIFKNFGSTINLIIASYLVTEELEKIKARVSALINYRLFNSEVKFLLVGLRKNSEQHDLINKITFELESFFTVLSFEQISQLEESQIKSFFEIDIAKICVTNFPNILQMQEENEKKLESPRSPRPSPRPVNSPRPGSGGSFLSFLNTSNNAVSSMKSPRKSGSLIGGVSSFFGKENPLPSEQIYEVIEESSGEIINKDTSKSKERHSTSTVEEAKEKSKITLIIPFRSFTG